MFYILNIPPSEDGGWRSEAMTHLRCTLKHIAWFLKVEITYRLWNPRIKKNHSVVSVCFTRSKNTLQSNSEVSNCANSLHWKQWQTMGSQLLRGAVLIIGRFILLLERHLLGLVGIHNLDSSVKLLLRPESGTLLDFLQSLQQLLRGHGACDGDLLLPLVTCDSFHICDHKPMRLKLEPRS